MIEKPVIKISSDLVHIEEKRVFVKVTAYINGEDIGSSIGEGSTADSAEESAISKIYKRIETESKEISININKEVPARTGKDGKLSNNLDHSQNEENLNLVNSKSSEEMTKAKPVKADNYIEDWSNILYEYQSELNRIGWDKEQENRFLFNNFNISSRDKITNYNNIRILIDILKLIKKGESSNKRTKYSDRDYLLKESNHLMSKLHWDIKDGRDYLYNNFKVKSRTELSNLNLLTFNFMLLESIKESSNK